MKRIGLAALFLFCAQSFAKDVCILDAKAGSNYIKISCNAGNPNSVEVFPTRSPDAISEDEWQVGTADALKTLLDKGYKIVSQTAPNLKTYASYTLVK